MVVSHVVMESRACNYRELANNYVKAFVICKESESNAAHKTLYCLLCQCYHTMEILVAYNQSVDMVQ